MKTLLLIAAVISTPFFALLAEGTNATSSAAIASPNIVAPTVIQADDTPGLESQVGTKVVVEGVVKAVGKTSDGNTAFINFGNRTTGFTAVVSRAALDRLPKSLGEYAERKVRVRGKLENYQNRQIQIKVSMPDQITIVSGGIEGSDIGSWSAPDSGKESIRWQATRGTENERSDRYPTRSRITERTRPLTPNPHPDEEQYPETLFMGWDERGNIINGKHTGGGNYFMGWDENGNTVNRRASSTGKGNYFMGWDGNGNPIIGR